MKIRRGQIYRAHCTGRIHAAHRIGSIYRAGWGRKENTVGKTPNYNAIDKPTVLQ
jgi:hypothetical protein